VTASQAAIAMPDLLGERDQWARQGRRVVFTNGCFDLLHAGHVRLLEAARAAGDILVVGLNSDRSVATLKGADRPFVPEPERAETLLALESVDRVVIFEDDTPLETIRTLLPDVLVKGADWALGDVVGRREVEAAGGRVVRVELLAGRSTTRIVEGLHRR